MDPAVLTVCDVHFADIREEIDEADVVIAYGQMTKEEEKTLLSWLKKKESRFLVWVAEREMKSSHPRMRIYADAQEERLFLQIAWEFVFLTFAYAQLESSKELSAVRFFEKLDYYHRGVDLLASDSQDQGVRVLKNAVQNLKRLPDSTLLSSLENGLSNVPAIVCGAGASLDCVAGLLKEFNEKALIIAGGSAIGALRARGICPHLCTAVDPDPTYERFSEEENTQPFFYQGRLSSQILEKVSGPLVWLPAGGSYPLEAWMAAECGIFSEPLESGWTVSNVAATIAYRLGCNPILLVGMDFACKEGQKEFVFLEKSQLYSKKDWLMCAEHLAAFTHCHSDRRWVHIRGESGLPLAGVEIGALQDFAHWQPQDIQGRVHALLAEAKKADVSKEQVKEVQAKLLTSFQTSLALCDQLLKVWEKHYPGSPLEESEYLLLESALEKEVCYIHLLKSLWDVWQHPILRAQFHPLGQYLHRLLFFKQTLQSHLEYLSCKSAIY